MGLVITTPFLFQVWEEWRRDNAFCSEYRCLCLQAAQVAVVPTSTVKALKQKHRQKGRLKRSFFSFLVYYSRVFPQNYIEPRGNELLSTYPKRAQEIPMTQFGYWVETEKRKMSTCIFTLTCTYGGMHCK